MIGIIEKKLELELGELVEYLRQAESADRG